MLFPYANYFACVYVHIHIHTHTHTCKTEEQRRQPLQTTAGTAGTAGRRLGPVPAVYSMTALGRHEGSRIVAAGLWEPCNRCDVLRHIVRSWQTLPSSFLTGPRPTPWYGTCFFLPIVFFIIVGSLSHRTHVLGLRLMSGWLGGRKRCSRRGPRFVTVTVVGSSSRDCG